MKADNKTKKESNIFPVVLGVAVIVVVVAGILILATWSQRVKEERDLIVATEQSEGDGELSDYEAAGYIKLSDYSGLTYTEDSSEDEEDEDNEELTEEEKQAQIREDIWDTYLEKCEADSYPDDLYEEALNDTKKQYLNFAYVSGVSYDELLESYGIDDESIDSVAKDTVLGRMVAKTIAYREGLSLSDADMEKYLLRLTDYEEGDERESLEELKKDYLENYSGRYADDCYVELIKDWLFDKTTIVEA